MPLTLNPPSGFCQSEIVNTIVPPPIACGGVNNAGIITQVNGISPNQTGFVNIGGTIQPFINPNHVPNLFVNDTVCTQPNVINRIILRDTGASTFDLQYFINSVPITNYMAKLQNNYDVPTIQAIINANIIAPNVTITVVGFSLNVLDVIIQAPSPQTNLAKGTRTQGMTSVDFTNTFTCNASPSSSGNNGNGVWAVMPQTGYLTEEQYQKRGRPNSIMENGVRYQFSHKTNNGRYVFIKAMPFPYTNNSYPSPLF